MNVQRDVIKIIDDKSEDIFRTEDPLRHATDDLGGARSFVAIPMLAADKLVGAHGSGTFRMATHGPLSALKGSSGPAYRTSPQAQSSDFTDAWPPHGARFLIK